MLKYLGLPWAGLIDPLQQQMHHGLCAQREERQRYRPAEEEGGVGTL